MKTRFTKNHNVSRDISNSEIKNPIQGNFCFYFNDKIILSYDQYKALIFFCRKKLKFYSKIFIRLTPKFKNTSKSIGMRMGKGKGSLKKFYFPIKKGQVFIEFGFDNGNSVIKSKYDYSKLMIKVKELSKLISYKLSINVKYLIKDKLLYDNKINK